MEGVTGAPFDGTACHGMLFALLGTYRTVMARFWPCFRQTSALFFKVFPFRWWEDHSTPRSGERVPASASTTHGPCKGDLILLCGLVEGATGALFDGTSCRGMVFSPHGTDKTVKARFWPWLVPCSRQTSVFFSRCSLLGSGRTIRRHCMPRVGLGAARRPVLGVQRKDLEEAI